jgi:hypothetical protein|tara:strand:+ start:678 stop:875 length:198 start_codon:yes stop_codon:yes gene_type:complete
MPTLPTLPTLIGRPPKGSGSRSARLSFRAEPIDLDTIDAEREPGESRADVIARWCREIRAQRVES